MTDLFLVHMDGIIMGIYNISFKKLNSISKAASKVLLIKYDSKLIILEASDICAITWASDSV